MPASPLETKVASVISLPSKVDTGPSPSPPISLGLEMPLDTQSMGIPMEMTPGEIMEAEMSAGSFLDDEVGSASTSTNMSEFLTHNRHSSPSIRPTRCSLGNDHETLSHAEQQTLPENVFTHDFISGGAPSPKTTEQSSSAKSASMTILDDLETDMEQARDQTGASFSLEGIVCSMEDKNGMVLEGDVKQDFENFTRDNDHFATETHNKEEKSICNNNQTQSQLSPIKSSTRKRKRNLSTAIDNFKNEQDARVSATPPTKRTRLRSDDSPGKAPVQSSIRTRLQRNSIIKTKEVEGTETKRKLDNNEDVTSFLNEDINSSNVSIIASFAGITAAPASTVPSVGDFDL